MEKEYHILSLSGGKDSTALAFFMRDNMPEIFEKLELVFCDTEQEIPETYDYLNKIEIFLNKKITILKPEKSFDHLYDIRKFLPSIVNRWCTGDLKNYGNQYLINGCILFQNLKEKILNILVLTILTMIMMV